MSAPERVRFKFTSNYPLKYGANAAAEFDNADWPRFVRITDVTPNGNLRDDTFRSLPPEVARGFELEEGDILLARSGATVGKTFIYDSSWGDACYAGYLVRSRTSASYWPKYIYWYLQSSEYWAAVQSNLIQATIQNFSAEKYANITIPSLPLETQKRIAAFLDEKTARIDALIEKKRALLDRLAEKRQAIITQAVTKGLNPAAPMKDSGIDWLGQIPAHWDVWPLKRVISSSTYGVSASLEPDGAIAILRMGNLQNGELDFTDLRYLDQVEPSLLIKARDVVFNRTNSLDLVGKASIYRGNYKGRLSLASYLVLFRFDERYNPDFANYAMGTNVLMSLGRTLALPSIGQANLNPNRYAAINFPIPPLAEQHEIATDLDSHLARLSDSEGKIDASIKHLIEYRSALITEAVTGKIEGLR